MSQLVVRNLEPLLVRRLKERAVAHGVSAEEEHRRILQSVLLPREDATKYEVLKTVLVDGAGPHDDGLFERIRESPRDFDLS